MARHRATLTRRQLIRRYGRATACSETTAWRLHRDTDVEELRDLVEALEREAVTPGGRRTFARSQPTTSLRGQTR